MKSRDYLLNKIKKILKEVRFGNLLGRLSKIDFPDDKELVNDFNNMIEALSDRENMIKENQKILLSQTDYLKTLLNMLNEGVMTLSEDLKIIALNTTQAKWFRKSKKKIVGEYLKDIISIYDIFDGNNNTPIDYSEFFSKDRKDFVLTFELRKIRMTLSVNVKKFLDRDERINYFVISKDITSDVKLQKLKDTFIATLTHDLKVPIVAESKVLDILLKNSNDSIQKEALENMILNNKDMMGLVSTLLDVYKIEEGVFKINKSDIYIIDIVNTEVEKLKFLSKEFDTQIKISNKSSITKINADEIQISRVIKNILTNAINFAPQNTAIDLRIFDDEKFLYISVTDKGKGIKPNDLPHIFDRYFTSAKKYRKVGTGLGLYLSKKIMLLHGGDITVESIVNKQTTFTIKIPF